MMENSVMLDLVSGGRKVDFNLPDPEEEEPDFGPDPADGSWRYVNLGPESIRQRLETEEDPLEKAALKTAFDIWSRSGKGYASAFEAGSVDQGEPREARVVGSLHDTITGPRVTHVFSMGGLRIGGLPSTGPDGGRFLGLEVIDYDYLVEMEEKCGAPEGDWFE